MDAIIEERSHMLVGESSDDKLSNYRIALNKAIQQNSELRAKLNNIHVTSDTSNFSDPVRIKFLMTLILFINNKIVVIYKSIIICFLLFLGIKFIIII